MIFTELFPLCVWYPLIIVFFCRKQKEPWDVFEERSKDANSQSNIQFWNNIFKITRVIFISVFAVIVCLTAVISKLTLIYMISNINAPTSKNVHSLKTYNGSVIYPAEKTEVHWIWAILICMLTPYLFTLIKSMNKIFFKKSRPIKPIALVVVRCIIFYVYLLNGKIK